MRKLVAAACGMLVSLSVFAQQPPYATTKVEGTDNVYVFRAGNHQAMFVTTKAGVIATDPIGYGRPEMVKTYIEEIKKVSDQPIKYLVYSHHHNDHISGGKPFKEAGATIVAHRRAKERILAQKDPMMVPPDETFEKQRTFLQDASAAVKGVAREGKCWEPAEKEVKLPKYEKWPGYENNLQFMIRRYCGLWGRGT